jgi:hypothetical protein
MEDITHDHALDLAKPNKILENFKEWVDNCKKRRSPSFTLKWIKIGQSMLKDKDVGLC